MRKNSKFLLSLIAILMFVLVAPVFGDATEDEVVFTLTEPQIDMIHDSVQRSMEDGRIPGLSLVIVYGSDLIFSHGFGYADLENNIAVTMETVFELGSNSKAFTGLAMLKLEQEGLVDFSAPVTNYVPWLDMMYNGENVDVTIEQVMNHTSGIPFSSIDRIPESTADDALEETVRTLVGMELQTRPGESYGYATINYNILGLIIEILTEQSFESYITENILKPIGLSNTYLFTEDVGDDMALGYKINFLRARVYDAPIYRGNTPAGYIMSNGNDTAKWMMTQLGFNTKSTFDQNLIEQSHEFTTPLWPGHHISYTAGWFVNKLTGEITHSGNNPNFSSSIILDTENDVGIAVLANLNSSFTDEIILNVMNIIRDIEPNASAILDLNLEVDRIAVVIIFVSTIIILFMIFFTVRFVVQVRKKQRSFVAPRLKGIMGIGASVVFLVIVGIVIYNLPRMFFGGIGWNTAIVWAPHTILFAVIFASVAMLFISFYLLVDLLYRRNDGIPFFFTIFVSILAGVGNALIIFMINESLRRASDLQFNLLLFFVLGIVMYAGGSRIARVKIIKVTNHMVYKLRMELVHKILNTPLERIEKLEEGVIQSTLNNDTEVVSNIANLIVDVITACTTVLMCFAYLGFINIFTLLTCILTIVVIAGIYFMVVQSADKLMEEARTTQDIFFKFINDMTAGFKELRLNIKRRKAFEADVDELSDSYNKKRAKAFLGFADAFVVGELVFTLAIGFVVFVFPVIFGDLQAIDLRSYVFVLLYLTGPVNGILNTIPGLMEIKVSWHRINKLTKEMSELSEKEVIDEESSLTIINSLTLKDVEYEYTSENAERFKIGPISYDFYSGEVVFITGGNGSGKSTLAKIITGLYHPQSGEILLNGQAISIENLEQKYSAIFGDFHLFDKLYGIDYETKREEFEKYMDIMQLSDKVKLEDGSFNTTDLSTGQRKRLALSISYLEDRPIYLFDEWAADQDPEFREFFYKELLPELKERKKCIIVISHDDRYFECADKLIKMEWGRIVDY